MTGIFGYFAEDVKENITRELMCDIESEGYSILEKVINDEYIMGKLDIDKSIEVDKSIKGKERLNIVTCGEVFNEDITDLNESILTFYENGELNFLKNLNGSFAAAIYDNVEGKLTLVNDRYGLIKLFYFRDKDCFCFAPKIKPLLKINSQKTLRKESIIDFFLFGYLLGDKTFFENVFQLPPASILEMSKGDIKLTKYWDYEYDEEYDIRSQETLINELGTLWQTAVKRRIKKDEKIIIPLSGGLDSRAILAAALKCTPKKNIITFTFGEKGSYDFEIGKMIAAKLGVKNIQLNVEKENFEEQYDVSINDIEGFIDATPYFPIQQYRDIGKQGDKLLIGYMGDPIMGSHLYSKMMNKNLESQQDYIKAHNLLFKQHILYDLEFIKGLFNPSYIKTEYMKSSFKRTLKEIERIDNKEISNYFAIWDYMNRQNKYTIFAIFRYEEHLKYSIPFLDNDLVDFMLKTTPELRSNEYLYRSMLLKVYPELFRMPTKMNFGLKIDANYISIFLKRIALFSKRKVNKIFNTIIKRNIFQDKFNNYTDYDDLLRNDEEYQRYIKKMIERVKERELFNRKFIEEIWKLHMQGKKNYSTLLGLLVTYELFLERFVDD